MDFEMPEFDSMTVGITIILWLFFSALIWFGPGIAGLKEYSLFLKIAVSIGLLPIAYLICNKMFNQ
jgi:hypothetical protein